MKKVEDIEEFLDFFLFVYNDELTNKTTSFCDGKMLVFFTDGENHGKIYFSYTDKVEMTLILNDEYLDKISNSELEDVIDELKDSYQECLCQQNSSDGIEHVLINCQLSSATVVEEDFVIPDCPKTVLSSYNSYLFSDFVKDLKIDFTQDASYRLSFSDLKGDVYIQVKEFIITAYFANFHIVFTFELDLDVEF